MLTLQHIDENGVFRVITGRTYKELGNTKSYFRSKAAQSGKAYFLIDDKTTPPTIMRNDFGRAEKSKFANWAQVEAEKNDAHRMRFFWRAFLGEGHKLPDTCIDTNGDIVRTSVRLHGKTILFRKIVLMSAT